jgi:hypothetical protein
VAEWLQGLQELQSSGQLLPKRSCAAGRGSRGGSSRCCRMAHPVASPHAMLHPSLLLQEAWRGRQSRSLRRPRRPRPRPRRRTRHRGSGRRQWWVLGLEVVPPGVAERQRGLARGAGGSTARRGGPAAGLVHSSAQRTLPLLRASPSSLPDGKKDEVDMDDDGGELGRKREGGCKGEGARGAIASACRLHLQFERERGRSCQKLPRLALSPTRSCSPLPPIRLFPPRRYRRLEGCVSRWRGAGEGSAAAAHTSLHGLPHPFPSLVPPHPVQGS